MHCFVAAIKVIFIMAVCVEFIEHGTTSIDNYVYSWPGRPVVVLFSILHSCRDVDF